MSPKQILKTNIFFIVVSCAQIYQFIKTLQMDPIVENCTPTKIVYLPENYKFNIFDAGNNQLENYKNEINDQSTEKELQFIFKKLMDEVVMKGTNLEIIPEKLKFKNKQHPDFSVIKKGKPTIPNYCLFVVELEKGKSLDSQHLGQVLMYNEMILQSNPRRPFIVSVLTNLTHMILFKTFRKGRRNVNIHSLPIEFWSDGLKYLNVDFTFHKIFSLN